MSIPNPAVVARSRDAVTRRRNARRSTGPVTPQGKAATRLNALQHGLHAQDAVLPSEDAAAHRALHDEYLRDHTPATAAERTLVAELAECAWRMQRIRRLESGLFENSLETGLAEAPSLLESPRFRLFAELSRQYGRYHRAFLAAVKQLETLQSGRKAAECASAQPDLTEEDRRDVALFLSRPRIDPSLSLADYTRELARRTGICATAPRPCPAGASDGGSCEG